ncbi:MAG: DNA polymerase, partial [Candidatus Paceibacterota bacterium]
TKQYMAALDSISHFPATMIKFPFPAGKSRWLDDNQLLEITKNLDFSKLGFYHISFTPPTNIRTPILLKHDEARKLVYDLIPGQGVYAHIEIQKAIKFGYKIDAIHKALVWDSECSTYFVDYMKKIIGFKFSESPLKRRMGKLMMNSLYGRMLYRDNFSKPINCTSLRDLQSYHENNFLTYFDQINDNLIKIHGRSRSADRKGTPIHLGCYIMAYARSLMLNFIEAIDPTLTNLSYYYTDNDSLFLEANNLEKFSNSGFIADLSNNDKLSLAGQLKNDIKNGECIIKATFIKQKVYTYTYVDNNGAIKHVIKTTGIPRDFVSKNHEYILDTYFDQMKTIEFVNALGTRTYSSSIWEGMDYHENDSCWYPYGYQF